MREFKKTKAALKLFLCLIFVAGSISIAKADIDPDDMAYEKTVTVWFHNGAYWQDQSGQIFVRKSTGQRFIKISHAMTVQKGFVYSNRDYTGGIKGGKRTSCRYMTKCDNDITYYFDM